MSGDDIDFTSELEGSIKYSYEQFHIFCMMAQQKLMLQKGNIQVREAMLDHQWYMIPERNKETFKDEWLEIEEIKPTRGSTDADKNKTNYKRIVRKSQLISNALLSLKVINYAPPSKAEEIILLGMEALHDEDD